MPRIDQFNGPQTYTSVRKQEASGTQSAEQAPVRGQADSVSLSAQSKSVGQMHQQLAAESAFDTAKVASIKQAIADGNYNIDAEKLADNMLRFEDELRGL